jgi:hypothetical protein
MDPLSIIGLGLQGVGAISNLFGPSEEELRKRQDARNQQALQSTLAMLDQRKRKAISEGVGILGNEAKGSVASARSAAMQRAAAAGRSGQSESYVLPAQESALAAGNDSITGFAQNTERQYDAAANNAEMGALDQSLRPLPDQPQVGDYLMPIGAGLTKYGMLRQPNATPATDASAPAPIQASQTPPAAFDFSTADQGYNPTVAADVQPNTPFKMQIQQGQGYQSSRMGFKQPTQRRYPGTGSIFSSGY